jgi:hypothetical protein
MVQPHKTPQQRNNSFNKFRLTLLPDFCQGICLTFLCVLPDLCMSFVNSGYTEGSQCLARDWIYGTIAAS